MKQLTIPISEEKPTLRKSKLLSVALLSFFSLVDFFWVLRVIKQKYGQACRCFFLHF